jgi:predicted nucleotidyltransferase
MARMYPVRQSSAVPHAYPTAAHERAADELTERFAAKPETQAVFVVNSCARGKATPDSCLDMLVLVPTDVRDRMRTEWWRDREEDPAVAAVRRAGRFSDVHLGIVDGEFVRPHARDEHDPLELRVGNTLVYSVTLFERGPRLAELRTHWLPFYDDERRADRLAWAREFCGGDLDRIPWYVERGLHFHAFDRLYRTLQVFLCGLHVSRRVYPIAYDKWIHEQVVENLGLGELYPRLVELLEVRRLESKELVGKAAALRGLVETYVVD